MVGTISLAGKAGAIWITLASRMKSEALTIRGKGDGLRESGRVFVVLYNLLLFLIKPFPVLFSLLTAFSRLGGHKGPTLFYSLSFLFVSFSFVDHYSQHAIHMSSCLICV